MDQAVRRGFLPGFTPFGLLSRSSEIDNVAHHVARRYPDNVTRVILAGVGYKVIRRTLALDHDNRESTKP